MDNRFYFSDFATFVLHKLNERSKRIFAFPTKRGWHVYPKLSYRQVEMILLKLDIDTNVPFKINFQNNKRQLYAIHDDFLEPHKVND